jgi:DNA-directed RNA polymerase specialized sigma24 family protein
LQRLPLDQRQVVLLAGLEKLSYAEVALALEIPIGTVMSRLSRGRVARTFARRLWATDGEQRRGRQVDGVSVRIGSSGLVGG